MKVELVQLREYDNCHRPWKKSLPFHVNPRGILTHRVRSVTSLWIDSHKSRRWESIRYYCGNSVCGSGHDLTDDPPVNRLLCERCEAFAAIAKQKPADELVGRHVHIGKLRSVRTCCPVEDN